VPIVQPGAPGQPSRTLRPEEAARTAETRYTIDDVRFMQDMIIHHRQAVEMSALVEGRTDRRSVIDAARRIDASQADEIRFMEAWLRERGEAIPAAGSVHAGHGGAGAAHHRAMPGMATAQQIAALAAARGTDFDRLFLARMIGHHEGAVAMARGLLAAPNSANDPTLFEFANEVINEQQGEIGRMTILLAGLADDPRTALAAGLRDAGQAIRNMRLVASLPKATGFFDPNNPAGIPPARPAAARRPPRTPRPRLVPLRLRAPPPSRRRGPTRASRRPASPLPIPTWPLRAIYSRSEAITASTFTDSRPTERRASSAR
jgi:uncharacterized protein (DUF305 family)